MEKSLMNIQNSSLFENTREQDEIILKGIDFVEGNPEKDEIDVSKASVEELSSMIVSRMIASVKKDLARSVH